MKRLLAPIAFLALSLSSHGALSETYSSGTLNAAIPDGNPTGLASVLAVTASNITQIDSVTVDLNVTGAFNGDLYVYLQHGGGLAVLLNRTGRTAVDPFGYGDGGFSVTFDDLAANDVHTYQLQSVPGAGNPLTGTWQPDGRFVDPDSVVDTDPRAALLSALNGGDANGNWTLFVADASGGDAHQLVSWSIGVNGIPEPGTAVLLLLGAGMLARRRRA